VTRAEELIADALRLLHAYGFVPQIRENGGKHIKVRWFNAGRRYTLVIPRSPGDGRARKNSRAVLKRMLRNASHSKQLGANKQ
jgi:hypothetical protein